MTSAQATDRFASKKFVVVVLTLAMAFVLALLGKLTSEFSAAISICVPVYLTGQTVVDREKVKANGG